MNTPFGSCDDDDLEDLDHAMGLLRKAEQDTRDARDRAGRVMSRMLTKGALRKSIAMRAGVNDQTVTNISVAAQHRRNGALATTD